MTDFFNFVTSIQEKKELDPVKDKALDKKFKNRKDKDIDNDGDVDSSDEYLHKRRKTIDKAIEKDKKKEKGVSEATTKELKDLNRGDDVMVNGKMGMFYGMKGSKVEVNFPGAGRKMVPAGDVEIMDLVMDDLEKDDDDPCWEGYVQVGTKMKDGKEVPKCVPMEEAKKQVKEELTEAKVNEASYDYPDYGPTGAAEMAMTQLYFIKYAAGEVIECLKAGTVMPEWYQNKIAKLEGDMEGIHSYMAGKKIKREMCGPEEMDMDRYDYDMDDEPEMDDDMDGAMMSMGMYEEASKKTEKELSKLMTKALGGKKPKAGFTSDIADNGDFVVRDGSGRVVGRIEKGDFKNPMKEETLNEKKT